MRIETEADVMTSTRTIAATVLVVEDEPVLLMETSSQLEDAGYAVIEAHNGHEALRILEAGTAVDIVCTDVRMPGTPDGIDLAKWIKDSLPDLPVVIASGGPISFSGPADAVFRKPIKYDLLLGRIKDLLNGRR